MKVFGDSITVGTGASPSTKSWIGLFTPQNAAVSGNGAGDMAKVIQTSHVADPSQKYAIMIGTNDARHYKSDTQKQGYFKNFLRSAIVWLTTMRPSTTQPTLLIRFIRTTQAT